jgi:hypothetical protein
MTWRIQDDMASIAQDDMASIAQDDVVADKDNGF